MTTVSGPSSVIEIRKRRNDTKSEKMVLVVEAIPKLIRGASLGGYPTSVVLTVLSDADLPENRVPHSDSQSCVA